MLQQVSESPSLLRQNSTDLNFPDKTCLRLSGINPLGDRCPSRGSQLALTLATSRHQVKRNLLNVSYHIAQYADVISDLGRQIKHPKAKVEKQEKEKRSIPEADMLKVGPYMHQVPPAAGPSGTPEAHCVLLPFLERCLH